MKNILIFVTLAALGIVIAYYLVIEKDGNSDDVSVSDFLTD
jgi:hypothetical protein